MTPVLRCCAVLLMTASMAAAAQTHQTHPPAGADKTLAGSAASASDPALARQIEQLHRQLKELETQMGAKSPPTKVRKSGRPGPLGGMPGAPAAAPAWECAECVAEMGIASGLSGGVATPSAPPLPAFPGAAHIYHVGGVDFFLDHAQPIGLSIDQQARLARLREGALLARASAGREIEEADQQLLTLTASDRPDADRIEAQVRRIEALRTARRLAFIRAVGEAAQVLNAEQQQAVLGVLP